MFEVLLGALLSTAPAPRTEPPSTAPATLSPSSRAVQLDELLAHARAHAPAIARSRARISLGTARIEGARPWLPANPTVSAGLGARLNRRGASFEAQVQVSQAVEIAGERGRRLAAARAAKDAREAAADRTAWETEVELRAAFQRAVLAREAVAARRQALAFSERIVETSRVRVELGEGSPLRLRIAEADLADARLTLLRATFDYRQACVQMAKLAGWPGDEIVVPEGQLVEPRFADDLRGAVESAIERHPAVVAARAQVRAAEEQLASAKRDAWPHPSLGVYAAREREPGTDFASHVGLLTVSIPLPLWQRNQGPRAEARAQLTVAKADLGALRYELARDLDLYLEAIANATRRATEYANDIMPRFSENLRLVQRAFELGEIGIVEVFVAQQRFLTQQQRALDVYAEYVEAVRSFELASGQRVY